MTECFTGD